jgi:glycosyltransferase involved in cell wall biosynthesis
MNTFETVKLSVVMPCYNEQDNIAQAINDVRHAIFSLVPNVELIVVDDGSIDRSLKIVEECAAVDSRIKVIHQTNSGHGAAIINGATVAAGEYIFFIDSDRQIPLSVFSDMWKEALHCQGVFGFRTGRCDPKVRLILSAAIRWVIRVMFGLSLKDANAPFKIIRREVWQDARRLIPDDTLAPSIFLAIFMAATKCDFVEMPVVHCQREKGQGSLNYSRLLKFCLKAWCQLCDFRKWLKLC